MKIIGEFRDMIIKPDGRKIIYPVTRNQIQAGFDVGLAGLCKGHNFGNGVGLGVNYIAYGKGNASWWTGAATFGTITAETPETYLFPSAGKLTVKFDNDATKIHTVDAATMVGRPTGQTNLTAAVLSGINTFLSPDGVAYRTDAGYLAIRTNTPGSTGSVQIIAQTTVADLADDSYLDLPIGTGEGQDSGYGNPTRDSEATQLYDEFVRQEILAADITWISPVDYSTSVSPTNAIQFTVSRPATLADETHGEYALYIGASATSGSGKMVNWSVRPTRLTKDALDTLQTRHRLIFSNEGD